MVAVHLPTILSHPTCFGALLLAQDEPGDLPRLSTPAFACVVALILVFWVMARVHAERRVQGHGKGPQTRLGFVRRMAAWPAAQPFLGLLAAALAVAAWLLR